MYEFLLILVADILALFSHLTRDKPLMEWLIRSIILCTGLGEIGTCFWLMKSSSESHVTVIYAATASLTILLLFKPLREFISWLITGLQIIITGQILIPLARKEINAINYFRQKRICLPGSLPNLMALFIYITATTYMVTRPQLLDDPSIVQQQLFCNGIPLLLLAFCGVGFCVSRCYKETLSRLSLVKLNKVSICIGFILVLLGFIYDALWIKYAHGIGVGSFRQPDLATKLSYYNTETFTLAGSFLPSVILALIITTLAAIGEETLIRGALQPVFGIIPSALFHGVLLTQFNHKPTAVLQIALWSIFMGIIKRYTNTTTTILGHAFFNIFTVLLYAANP